MPQKPVSEFRFQDASAFQYVMKLGLRDADLTGQASFGKLAISDLSDNQPNQALAQFVKSEVGPCRHGVIPGRNRGHPFGELTRNFTRRAYEIVGTITPNI